MGNNTVSVYIDDSSVRVMVTHGKRIARIADMAIESGLAGIDTPEKETELAEKIRQLLKFNKIGERKIVLGVSGLRCLTRPVVLPELPKAMLGEAVVREAKRLLPVPLEQLYLSWQFLSSSGGKSNVFLVALPRQLADMLMRVMTRAGYKPYMMDIKPLALARLSKEPDAIILDVQPKEFDIVVMSGGVPQPIRTVAFPQDSLAIEDKFEIVKEELKRTLEFVRSRGEESSVKPETIIHVSGDIAERPEFHEELAKETGLKVDKLTSPLKYLKYLEPSQYLANIGLALKVYIKEAGALLPNFNTLPQPYQPMHISMNKLMAVPAGLCAVGVLALLFLTVRNASADIEMTSGQITSNDYLLQKKQAQKKDLVDSIAKLEQQVQGADAEYDVYTAALKAMDKNGTNVNNDLTTSVNNVNDGLVLAKLTLSEDAVTLAGGADSEDEVFAYVRSLTASGRFSEITIGKLDLTGDGVESRAVNYYLACVLKEGR